MKSASASLLALVVLGASVLVACTADSTDVSIPSPVDGSSTSSGASRDKGSKGTSGNTSSSGYDYGESSSSSTSTGGFGPNPDPLDIADVRSITIGKDVCGGVANRCNDRQSFTVDFDKKTLTHTTCVEVEADGGTSTTDANETKTLDDAQLSKLRSDLYGVRISSGTFDGFDGPISTLEVTTSKGSQAYSPFAGCSKERFKKIEKGWDAVWDTVRGL